MTSGLRQVFAVLAFGIRSHIAQPRHAVLIASGFLIAVGTVVFLLAIPAGLERLAEVTGRDDVAIILQSDARSEIGSVLSAETVAVVSSLPGIARNGQGKPLIAPQYLASTRVWLRDGTRATVQMRGVTAETWEMLGLEFGQAGATDYNPGTMQLLAGTSIASLVPGVSSGRRIGVRNKSWEIKGIFTPGGLWNSEFWCGMASLQAAFNGSTAVSVLWVKLAGVNGLAQLRESIQTDRRLYNVRVQSQRTYYGGRMEVSRQYAGIAALVIALVLGFGAVMAVGNTLNLALDGRRRELAVLRALGFRDACIAVAVLVEVAVIGLFCAAVASAAIMWAISEVQIHSSTGIQSFAFHPEIDLRVAVLAVAYTVILGLLSAIFPLVRVLRSSLLGAMRRA